MAGIPRWPAIRGPIVRIGAVVLTGSVLVAGCHFAPPPGSSNPTSSSIVTTTASAGTLRVYVATPLRGVLNDLAKMFGTDHPGTQTQLRFGDSADLVGQLKDGDADVLVAADATGTEPAAASGLVDHPVDFASDRLAIVVAPGNPHNISSFAGLAGPGLRVSVCNPQTSCGAATTRVAAAVGLNLDSASREASVADVIAKVTSGQADAGPVYIASAKGAGDKVTVVQDPAAAAAIERYAVAVVSGTRNAERAKQFAEFVSNDSTHRLIADAGFGRP